MVLEKRHAINIKELDGPSPEGYLTPDFIKSYLRMSYIYRGAMNEVSTKLDILNDEFSITYDHNPIHHMECRLKSPDSVVGKLVRKSLDVTTQNVMEHIQDVAGIRVICNYVDDIYRLAAVLEKHKDLSLIRKTDYISEPKENGYRSLHLVVEVPVVISEVVLRLPVEIQLRTIAMDMWASLEHEIHYKTKKDKCVSAVSELRDCADQLYALDVKMQGISQSVM